MSDPNDVWQNSGSANGNGNGNGNGNYREGSPRRDEGARSPRRDRSRSPAARNGDAGSNRGRNETSAPPVNPGNNLHISSLSRTVTERVLEEYFSKIGKVQKVQIMVDPHSQESRGFGFVMMDAPEDAQAAIDQLNGQNLEGKNLNVAHARRGRARTPTPGRYHGVKQDSAPRYPPYGGGGYDRPYQPRSYDARYSDRGPPPRGYDDRDRRYDDRRDERRYDDRRYDDRREYAPRDAPRDRDDHYSRPPPDYYYSRSARDDRERGYERREERPRYDERPRY